jgi:hypothetical protein
MRMGLLPFNMMPYFSADQFIHRGSHADEWFQRLEELTFPLLPSIPKDRQDRVKIAILDSGIDMSNSFISFCRKRITYQSFLPGDTRVEDDIGHGTHTAGLVLQVARNADIYVARVTRDGNMEKPEFIAKVPD